MSRIASAALATCLLFAGCALPGGDVVLGRFTAPDGRPVTLTRSSATGAIYVESPGYAPLAPRRLRDLSNPVVAGSGHTTDRLIVLVQGAAPGCPVRNVLLASKFPETATAALTTCDRTFTIASRTTGDAVLLETNTVHPVYYVYRDGTLFGPQPQVTASIATTRHARAPQARQSAATAASAPVGASGGVDLDALAVPPVRQGVDLDR